MKRNSDYRPLATNQKLRAKRMGISTGQTITIHDRMQQEKPLKLVMGRCLRSMPGRRAVYEGVLHGSDVVIKVFTSAFHGWRHFRRELRGLETLANRNINTAEILTYGRYKKDWVLVLKKIENANDVHTLFTNMSGHLDKIAILKAVLEQLANMHLAGILQKDLHLGNFLWDCKTTYVLDPAQILFLSKPIGEKMSFRQLGRLATAFMHYDHEVKKDLFRIYFSKRNWNLDQSSMDRIEDLACIARQRGIIRSLKKTMRTCTHFVRQKSPPWSGIFDRTVFKDLDLAEFMANLDTTMSSGNILKNGNTCFVSRIDLNGHRIVVKRYNHKGFWHSVRHTIKGSRARKCWLFGHRLNWLNIRVAKPLAFIEKRKWGMIWQSYIINEFLVGSDIRTFFEKEGISGNQKRVILKKTHTLLDRLTHNGMTHGDLKATNIFVSENEPVLIDLDSMKRHRFKWLLKLYRQKMENKIREQNL